MKKFYFLFAFLLTLVGGTSVWAQDAYTCGFESSDGWASERSSSWIYSITSCQDGWGLIENGKNLQISTSKHGGSNSLYSSTSNTVGYVVSPKLAAGTISFYGKRDDGSGYLSFYKAELDGDGFKIVGDPIKKYTKTEMTSTSSWFNFSFELDEDAYIAILLNYFFIDDFSASNGLATASGGIAKPSNFTVSNVTYNSAKLSWTAGGEETAWQLVYSTESDFDKDAATPVDVTENPYTLSGLSDGTTYYAYLRAKKGDDVSAWTSKISFTTPEQYPKPTAFATTGYTATTTSFAWTAGSTETAWQIAYSTTQGFDPASGTVVDVTVNPFTLEGLTAETTYFARIRANYGSGFSAWSDEISFTPSAKMDLTVNDGTNTNTYVPFYGSYVDTQGTMSQFIIPASDLTTVVDRQITKMTFYSSSTSKNWNAKFKVYVKEVTETTFSSTECDWTGMEVVAEATVNLDSNGEMTVKFDSPYAYSGDNLMVGFNLTTTGSYSSCSWYGVNSGSNTARYSYQGWSGATNAYASFIPKVTITSTPGSSVPQPKLTVTQPESLDFGIITAATDKTFTIANTGKAVLEGIQVTSSNAAFTIKNAPATLEVGASAVVTITMAASTTGEQSSTINISATNTTKTVDFTVKGVALPADMSVIDFEDNQLPARWTNAGANWSFTGGAAYAGYSSSTNHPVMTTPKVVVNDGDMLVLKAKLDATTAIYYVTVKGSSDNGETWTAYTKKMDSNTLSTEYQAIILSDIPSTVNRLQFEGYYASIDEIWGINYAAELAVKKGEEVVTSPATYDFGEINAETSVTYNFANTGSGTINIIGVAITGDGAAAYSTNLAAVEALPFDLVITRSYDASRAGSAQDAVVTVSTTEGDFIINVTGTDKAANLPELAVDLTSLDFGRLTASDTKTVTVTNNGTGLLTVTIASDSEDFTVSASTLEDIAAGESRTFDVTFNYTAGNFGAKSATITVTPTYDATAAVAIAATAKAADPDVWSEDFSGNALPTGWNAQSNWTFDTGVAKAAYAYGTTNYLTTPILTVSDATDELNFEYKATANYVSIKIQMSKNGGAFADYQTISGLNTMTEALSYTITGLEAGEYQFRFANDDYELDNFEGFKLNLADHIATISSYTIPESSSWNTTMKESRSFDATVTVKEMRGVAENLTAKFYMGDEVIGTATGSVAANGEETLTITATPTTATPDGAKMHIEVEWAGGVLKTEEVTRYVAALTYLTLDENSSDAIVAGTYDVVTLKRTFIAGWNTVCLPFDIDDVEAFFGPGAKAYEFNNYSSETGLNFKTVTELNASYPYIVYVTIDIDSDFDLTDIEITSTNTEAFYTRKTDGSNNALYFRGTYAPMAAGSLEGKYGVTDEAKIAKGTASATMKGFRAYFELTDEASTARLLFDGEDVTTGIDTIENGQLTIDNIYDLQGRKIVNSKSQKGLYIINGKKVVIK